MPALGLDDGLDEVNGPARPGSQARATDLNTRLHQTPMLPIQRQVIAELVDQHAGEEAHIGDALFQHVGRCRGGDDCQIIELLVHRAGVLEDDLAAGPLRQAVGDLLANAHAP
jgi:hypothetical protein